MPVPAQTTLFNESTANGLTTSFPYEFMIASADDLTVELDGIETTTGFTVTGVGDEVGGAVVFSVAPANGVTVLRYLDPVLERETDYQQLGDFDADTVNFDFNRIWLAIQSIQARIGRAIKLPVATSDDQIINMDTTDRAGRVIGFDALGNLVALVGQAGSSLVDLAASSGASLMGFIQSGAGAIASNVQTVLREFFAITRYGAVPSVDCSAALIAAGAATTGEIFVPPGAFVATATTDNSALILALLNRIRCAGTLVITCTEGTHELIAQAVVNSPDAQRIQVIGATPISTTATSQVSVSGSAKAYSVTIGVASSAGAAVGDYALIRTDVTGTGDFYAHAGVWKITAVDSGGANRLTLLNTHHGAAFPTNTLTGGTVVILKTVLQFTGCDGFRFEGGQPLGKLDQMAIVGDYDLAAATGTTGAHGLVISAPVITGGGSSNAIHNMAGNSILGASVAFSAWGEQGIAVSGRGTLLANFVASCSNRKRAWYSEGGHIRAKFSIGSGNGEDGYISDVSGALQSNNSISCGNGLSGFWSTNGSLLACATSYATGNLSHGFEARGLARLAADGSIGLNNGGSGFNATDGGMIDADSATATGNGNSGFYASSGSIIDSDNSTSTTNTGYGYRAEYGSVVRAAGCTVSGNTVSSYYSRNDSTLFESGGSVNANDVGSYSVAPRFYNSTKANYWSPVLTGVGDLVWTTGTSRFVMKTDGMFYPAADNTQTLGRSSERWSVVYAGTGTINTSDERTKQDIRPINEAERAVAVRLKSLIRAFKFRDSVLEKGDGARIHFGVIAQEVRAAFEAEGLDPFSYALLCYDEWPEQQEERDEDGAVVVPYRAAGNQYGVRYDELLSFIIVSL